MQMLLLLLPLVRLSRSALGELGELVDSGEPTDLEAEVEPDLSAFDLDIVSFSYLSLAFFPVLFCFFYSLSVYTYFFSSDALLIAMFLLFVVIVLCTGASEAPAADKDHPDPGKVRRFFLFFFFG